MQQKRSIFGPLLLIAVGAIWLLVKSGNIPSANLWALTHVWPFLLIAAGIGILLRPYWNYTPIVLDVLIVGGVVLSIVYAPKFGWASPSLTGFINSVDVAIGPGKSGSGRIISQTREVTPFHAIELDYPAQVFITQGDAESIKIKADDNLLPDLKTEVRNGTLTIFYRKTGDLHINPTEPVIITLTVKDLDEVKFSSAGELTIDALKTDGLKVSFSGAGNLELNKITVKNLSVNISGAGSMNASGAADDFDLNISGFGDFKGADLHGRTARVNISGAGSATVWVDDELDAEISGAGSVIYYGSPSVSKQISGLGSVSHSGDK